MVTVSTWQEWRYVREGLEYLREYYHDQWEEGHDAYFTPERVRERQRAALARIRRREQFGNLYGAELREPTIQDIDNGLANGMVASIAMPGPNTTTDHATLVYGARDDLYEIYYPDRNRDGLMSVSRGVLSAQWRLSEGLTIVGR